LDCPKGRPAFLADRVWRVNDSATAKNLRILAIGSSSTEGIGASAPAFTYPAQLQARLAILLGGPVEVDNFGVGGETVAKTAVKTPFVLLDPQFYPGLKDIAHYEQYVRIIHDAGERNGAALFSRYALMKEWGAESDGLLRAMLSKDAFHMSDRGYGCLAQSLAADLAPRLRHLSTQAIDSSGVTGSIVK
jgi:acyl-CoA thioesterase-1